VFLHPRAPLFFERWEIKVVTATPDCVTTRAHRLYSTAMHSSVDVFNRCFGQEQVSDIFGKLFVLLLSHLSF
jgi:hypothetical protein